MSKKQVLPYQNKNSSKKTQVRQMFDGISPQYDMMNRIISGGIDVKWRKNVVALLLPKKPQKILDVATGTGDLAVALSQTQAIWKPSSSAALSSCRPRTSHAHCGWRGVRCHTDGKPSRGPGGSRSEYSG